MVFPKCSYRRMLTSCAAQKEREDLDDVSNELELADEEAMIP
jgi:hypothetical protein